MIPVQNIYYMLAYAYGELRPAGARPLEGEAFEHLHSLLAEILMREVSSLIKRGLCRGYRAFEAQTAQPRGKIAFGQTVRMQTAQTGRVVCVLDGLTEDTAPNRILKGCLLLLVRRGRLPEGQRGRLRGLLHCFSQVREIDPVQVSWAEQSGGRGTAGYGFALFVCRLLLSGMLMRPASGDTALREYLDEGTLARLYEAFVRNYYRVEHPALGAAATVIPWHITGGGGFPLPKMRTDTVLRRGGRTLIIDTKVYGGGATRPDRFTGKESMVSSGLYQIFAYVKNEDKAGTGKVSGLLLYAQAEGRTAVSADYALGSGNRIGVRMLDLGQDFAGIRQQLDGIVADYLR